MPLATRLPHGRVKFRTGCGFGFKFCDLYSEMVMGRYILIFIDYASDNYTLTNRLKPVSLADEDVQNQLNKLNSPISQRLADIIASGDDGGVEAVRKAIDFYQSCMDNTTIESLGATPLLNLIQDTLGTM